MTKAGTSAFGAMLVAGSVITAPAQRYPGQPTDAKVWIQNRAKTEAIPISVQDISVDTPLNVRVAGLTPVQVVGGVELKRQRWEYQTVLIRPGQDIAAELNRAGSDSWETTSWHTQDSSGILFVMKRPR